jgi:hypothetical protein
LIKTSKLLLHEQRAACQEQPTTTMAKVLALCQEALKWGRFGRQLSTYFTATRYLLTFDKYLPGVSFSFFSFCFVLGTTKTDFSKQILSKNFAKM